MKVAVARSVRLTAGLVFGAPLPMLALDAAARGQDAADLALDAAARPARAAGCRCFGAPPTRARTGRRRPHRRPQR